MENVLSPRIVIISGVLDIAKELTRDPRIDGKVHIAVSIPENDYSPYIEVRFLKPTYIDPIVWATVEFLRTSSKDHVALMTLMAYNRDIPLIADEGERLIQIEDAKPQFERLLALLDTYEDDYPVDEQSEG
jgi:hypothetical protein